MSSVGEAGPLYAVASDAWQRTRDAVDLYGSYLSRELDYDSFVRLPAWSDALAYVWLGNPLDRQLLGACVFSWMTEPSGRRSDTLEWVWFHPFARRRGRLRSAWPLLRERHGSFAVAPPLSAAMTAFLRGQHPSAEL